MLPLQGALHTSWYVLTHASLRGGIFLGGSTTGQPLVLQGLQLPTLTALPAPVTPEIVLSLSLLRKAKYEKLPRSLLF